MKTGGDHGRINVFIKHVLLYVFHPALGHLPVVVAAADTVRVAIQINGFHSGVVFDVINNLIQHFHIRRVDFVFTTFEEHLAARHLIKVHWQQLGHAIHKDRVKVLKGNAR